MKFVVLLLQLVWMTHALTTIRRGKKSDDLSAKTIPWYTLPNTLDIVKKLPGGITTFNNATIVNVGAANQNDDPIYSLELKNHFTSNRIIGYECRADVAKKMMVDTTLPTSLTVRSMCVDRQNIIEDMKSLNVPEKFALLKIDIDSVDASKFYFE